MAKITKNTLDERGVYAQVSHLRRASQHGTLKPKKRIRELRMAPLPRGGRTIAKIRDKQTNTLIAVGIAECSDKDQFCKRVGWQIAVGRALATIDT